MGELKLIPLNKIVVWDQNPRKHFDEKDLSELADSIREKGLIQPILVRPKGKKWLIVCGERRYRASLLAEQTEIMSVVRELSDDDAFELAIIENLQRKDVHPLDEAVGFKQMIDTGRYTPAEIGLRIGKSENYVYHRIKLNDLCKELKQSFFENKFGIGHALEICRLPESDQKELYEMVYKGKEDNFNGYPTLHRLTKLIDERFICKLTEAKFDIADPELVPEAGPCATCSKRSGANPSLFHDVDDKDLCFDRTCFNKKLAVNKAIQLNKAIEDGLQLIASKYTRSDEDLRKRLKKEGNIVLIEYDDFEITKASLKNDGVVKAYWIDGWNAGETTKIKLNKSAKVDINSDSPENEAQQQIININLRESRAVEIDREKVQRRIIERLSDDEFKPSGLISKDQLLRFVSFSLWDSGIHFEMDNDLEEASKKIIDHQGSYIAKRMAVTKLLLTEGEFWIVAIMKAWYRHHCVSQSALDYEKVSTAHAYRKLAELLMPEEVAEFDKEQLEIATKRKKRVEKRIQDLKKKAND